MRLTSTRAGWSWLRPDPADAGNIDHPAITPWRLLIILQARHLIDRFTFRLSKCETPILKSAITLAGGLGHGRQWLDNIGYWPIATDGLMPISL